jgi:3-methyladenine DNA glycosylase AlkC
LGHGLGANLVAHRFEGMKRHPAQRFSAPSAIQRGVPLKEIIDRALVKLIGESLSDVVPDFDAKRFRSRAQRGLKDLELKDRAQFVADAMAEQLPSDFDQLAPLLIRSLGPPLKATEDNGLAPMFYLPHAQLIATYGVAKLDSGMLANYELTQRFTAEFSVRPFLIQHRTKCLKRLRRWTSDSNPHVRRLVSEGTRPRLPWAMRLREFQDDPNLSLPLLERLKDDPELYVRRSVANHLADIAKDHAEVAFDVCQRWIEEASGLDDSLQAKHRRWMVRHALRHPAKKGTARALAIRKSATDPKTSSPKTSRQ